MGSARDDPEMVSFIKYGCIHGGIRLFAYTDIQNKNYINKINITSVIPCIEMPGVK